MKTVHFIVSAHHICSGFLRILAHLQRRRLYLSLTASGLLHGLLLSISHFAAWLMPQPIQAPTPYLQAHLLPSPSAQDLLKNTLDEMNAPVLALHHTTHPQSGKPIHAPASRKSAERKLAEHLFYPPEAIASGLQGEVRLLLVLDTQGSVIEVKLASSSGHDLLDQAAIAAAQAMGRLPDTGVRELILPVVFKLQ